MKNYTITGLDQNQASKMSKKLNALLASYSVFHMNLRGLHWNVCGSHFFRLHKEYEAEYLDAYEKIDEIAERIRQLSDTPYSTFSDYEKYSEVSPITAPVTDQSGIKYVLEGYKAIMKIEQEIMEISEEIKDHGTNDMIAGYMRKQAKRIWMFNSVLSCSI